MTRNVTREAEIAGEHYQGQEHGWVVTHTSQGKRGPQVSFWYGPDHGFGTTSGPLGYSARVWPTKFAAEWALRHIYGRPGAWRSRGYEPVNLSAVER